MLRQFLRSIAINAAGIYIAAKVLSGIIVYVGGPHTLFLAALGISLANLLVNPIVNLLLLPLNLVTMGVFRWLANMASLFLVTRLVPNFSVQPFTFPRTDLVYLIIPDIQFSAFGAFVVATLGLSVIFHVIYWLLQD